MPKPRTPATRDHIVMIRVTPDEKQDATRAAERAGLPLSSYIRDRALSAARRENGRAA